MFVTFRKMLKAEIFSVTFKSISVKRVCAKMIHVGIVAKNADSSCVCLLSACYSC